MFNPTPEQQVIVEAATDTTDNLLISALAGAAKTTTLVLIAEALPTATILCLAFNKKIALEMQERLPSNCKAMTLNSLGHRVWSDAIGRRIVIESGKVGDIMKDLIAKMEVPEERSAAFENFGDLIKLVGFAKQCGWIPEGYGKSGKSLMTDDEFLDHCDERLADWEFNLIRDTLRISLDLAFRGTLDYDDQILMPTLFPAVFPRYPVTLIDEAQDLSLLNHVMLKKLVGQRRLIAVGDACQAIYGFRGAHEDSMTKLENTFAMKKLGLSISFRCPRKIVEHARWRAPHMQWPEWAVEGEVLRKTDWEVTDLPDHAAVICRNNAPLFSLAIKLLQRGRYAQLAGNDIGKGLLKIMRKFGGNHMPQRDVMLCIEGWLETKLRKTKDPAPIHDRALCMRVFAEQGKNLGEAIAYAEHVFASDGPIKLMTGHKSKGLEFEDVYFLDSDLVGDRGQERNLRYVIITRSKLRLTYINSDMLVHDVA